MSTPADPAGHAPGERAPAPHGRPTATPERWQAIDRVLQAALARPPERRSSFVEAACDGDQALRREVQSLLAAAVASGDTAGVLRELAREAGRGGTGIVDAAASDAASSDGPDGVARLAAALAGRYEIERELGRGGMATVYLARDPRHKRRVALKVLDTRLGTLLGATRFRREIETAARLSHPHILSLFDSGEAAGRLYYVMPYVAGESLRDRIRRVGAMPVPEVVRIAREVADALDHAHRRGVVHRDVKPANILLDGEGRALVADFGIARALHTAGGVASRGLGQGDERPEPLTLTGAAVGTPGYMSPEQWGGDGEVDARADVYALGCVLREMLVGAPCGAAGDGRLPTAIRRVVRRATAQRAADRYASAGAFAAALAVAARDTDVRRLLRVAVPTAALATVAALGWWAWGEPAARPPATPRARSLAVLPCATRAADPARAYLAEGVTRDLIAEASRSRAFDRVIGYASMRRYRGAATPPAQIGAELRADVLLYCDYERTAAHERLRVEAVRATDGAVLWTDAHAIDAIDGNGAESGGLPARLVTSLVGALGGGPRVRDGPTDPIRTTDDLQALNLYKEGRFHLEQFREDAVRRSVLLFRQALARDSTFAQPYVGLAHAYFLLGCGMGRMHEREAFPLMKELAERALALDDRLAEAHWLLGLYEGMFAWNWVRAERRLRRAIALDPNSAAAHRTLGWALANLGRYAEAFALSDRALELDPVDPLVWGDAGVVRIMAGRYAEAVPLIEKGLALAPDFGQDHWALGAAYTELGDSARALPHLRLADSLAGYIPSYHGHLGYGYAVAGDTAAARAILRDLEATVTGTGPGKKAASAIASVHAGLGEADSAFAWFEVAHAEHLTTLATYLPTPIGRRLSGDPRYAALLRRVGLPLPPWAVSRR